MTMHKQYLASYKLCTKVDIIYETIYDALTVIFHSQKGYNGYVCLQIQIMKFCVCLPMSKCML